MAKPLDPKAIEAERQTSSRAERREQKRRQMQDEISYNQRGNGVIIIPPQKRRELAEEPPKLRVAAYCRVSTQEEQQVGSFDIQIHHFTKRIEANPQWELVEIYQDEGISAESVRRLSRISTIFLPKRLMLFVRIRSIFPSTASAIIF